LLKLYSIPSDTLAAYKSNNSKFDTEPMSKYRLYDQEIMPAGQEKKIEED